jgi:hypothetical protein
VQQKNLARSSVEITALLTDQDADGYIVINKEFPHTAGDDWRVSWAV